MRPRTWTLLITVLLALVALAAVAFEHLRGGVPVEVAEARIGAVREYVEEQAQTRLPRTYVITMPYQGRIQAIELEEGESVEKGQVVARVVPEDLALRVAEAQAAVDRLDASIRENADTSVEQTGLQQSLKFLESMDQTVAAALQQVTAGEARKTYANREFARVRALVGRDAASAQDLNRVERDQIEAEVALRQAQLLWRSTQAIHAAMALMPPLVRQYIDRKALKGDVLAQERAEAAARLEAARLDQKRGTMLSPIDGVVLRREVESEGVLSAGSTLLELGRLADLEIEAEVLTQDAVRIAEGQPVEILGPTVDSIDARGTVRKTFPAAFTKLSSLGVEQQRVKVLVSLDSESLIRMLNQRRVGVGYRVRVRIVTAEASKVVRIPRSAAFRAADGSWRTFAVEQGRARLRPITIGLSNDDWVEVRDGLSPGALVIPAPEADLADGARAWAVGGSTR
jgi:HlyD family secretion protein